MPQESTVKAPPGLSSGGGELWRTVAAIGPLRADQVRILEDACRTADLIDLMVADLKDAPRTVLGSYKQPVAHPLIGEVRQNRALLRQLLSALDLPVEDRDSSAEALTAREAATALSRVRWSKAGA